jgi:hypothetical protein
MWHTGNSTFPAYIMNKYIAEEYGVDEIYAPDAYSCLVSAKGGGSKKERILEELFYNPARLFSMYDQVYLPYLIPVLYKGQKLVRDPCLNDPGYRNFFQNIVKMGVEVLYNNGLKPPCYSISDEFVLTFPGGPDVCFSQFCIKDFEGYVKEKYKSLEKMNEIWRTDFKNWEDVKPITLDEAKKLNQPARWIDHRLHMDQVIINLLKFVENIILSVDPTAKWGFEGMFRSYSEVGYNLEKITEICNFLISYEYPYRWEMLSSFAKKDSIIGVFSNTYGGIPSGTRYQVWKALFHNLNAIWWWRLSGNSGILGFDLGPGANVSKYENFKVQAENVREIRKGLAFLLKHAKRVYQPVALLHSQESIHAVKLYGRAEDVSGSWAAFQNIFEDLGIGYRYIKSSELIHGEISPEQVKILILPYAISLPEEVVSTIKNYVKSGGIVLADIRPGMLDEHGRWCGKGFLDEIFGIKMKEPKELIKKNAKLNSNYQIEEIKELTVDSAIESLNREEVSGYAENIPIGIRHKYGKGMGILLNFLATDYGVEFTASDFSMVSTKKDFRINRGIKELVAKLIESAKIEKPFGIDGSDNVPIGFELFVYQKGNTKIFCILRKFLGNDYLSIPDNHTIYLKNKTHLYDVRGGKYLGYGDRFDFECGSGEAKIFVSLPYKFSFTSLKTKVNREKEFPVLEIEGEVDTGIYKDIYHILQLQLINPKGEVISHYQKKIIIEEKSFKTSLSLAKNDISGTWKLIVTDVATKVTQHINFEL